MGSRTNYLRITDATTGELFDRKELTGAAIDSLALVPNTSEQVPPVSTSRSPPATSKLGVALLGAVQEGGGSARRSGSSIRACSSCSPARRNARGTALEMSSAATPGTYGLSVTAGNRPAANVDVVVVDHLDSLVADDANDDIGHAERRSRSCASTASPVAATSPA